MKIVRIEDFHADGGWANLSFLKITTDEGIVGWSECTEFYGSQGLTLVTRKIAEQLIGQDPREVGRITALLYAQTRIAAGSLNAQAVAAIENACLDIKAKSLGVPVSELVGGAVRSRLPVYWSHCGMYRVRFPEIFEKDLGEPALRTLDDVKQLGREVVKRGYNALKTNALMFEGKSVTLHSPGFGRGQGHPELNLDSRVLSGIVDLLTAFREGAGPETGLMIDLNFNYKPEGYRKIARAVEHLNLTWLEIDTYEAKALSLIRQVSTTPIASLESTHGRRNLRPFLENHSVDVAILDPMWNGVAESVKMAAMCDAYEVNVAAHNFCGHLQTMIAAQFCAAVPNFRILELDVDRAPWLNDLFTHVPEIENGELVVSNRPGWGTDINEDGVRAHPPKKR